MIVYNPSLLQYFLHFFLYQTSKKFVFRTFIFILNKALINVVFFRSYVFWKKVEFFFGLVIIVFLDNNSYRFWLKLLKLNRKYWYSVYFNIVSQRTKKIANKVRTILKIAYSGEVERAANCLRVLKILIPLCFFFFITLEVQQFLQ